MKSSSSGQKLSLRHKIDEWHKQFRALAASKNSISESNFFWLENQLHAYEEAALRFGGFHLNEAKIFEIGCGQKPHRLLYLSARGLDVRAIDLDYILIEFSFFRLVKTFYYNGFERLLKTIVRNLLFDRAENKSLREYLSRVSGRRFDWPMQLIAVGNAADQHLWPVEKIDFIYSEDVFEHIPASVLPAICQQIHRRLSPRGIAWIKPLIYTGIQGGHSFDWYSLDQGRSRTCPPWDHLRDNRYPANTFLNKLTRNDYRALFSQYFDILEEKDLRPNLGQCFMTAEIRKDLANYTDEDLYSNGIVFILRPKKRD